MPHPHALSPRSASQPNGTLAMAAFGLLGGFAVTSFITACVVLLANPFGIPGGALF